MNIAMFSYHFWGNNSAEAIVTRKVYQALKELGNRLTVYTWSRQSETDFDLTEPKNLTENKKISRMKKVEYTIKYYPFSFLYWPPNQYIIKSINTAIEDHQKEPFDLIYSRSNKVMSHIAALGFQSRYSLPWVAGFNDPYPESLYPSSYDNSIKKRGGLHPLTEKWVTREIYSKPDSLIFPSTRLRDHILRNFSFIDPNKCQVVPHIGAAFEGSLKTPESDTFVISHVGKLDKAREPMRFLEAWDIFSKTYEQKVEFRQIGRVDHELIRSSNSRTITVVPPVSYDESIREIDKTDVALLIEAPMEEGIFLPSKFADYVSRGKPILCLSPSKGTINDYIANYGGGIVVDPLDTQGILNALRLLSDTLERKRFIPDDQLKRLFSSSEIGKQIDAIFKKAVLID